MSAGKRMGAWFRGKRAEEKAKELKERKNARSVGKIFKRLRFKRDWRRAELVGGPYKSAKRPSKIVRQLMRKTVREIIRKRRIYGEKRYIADLKRRKGGL